MIEGNIDISILKYTDCFDVKCDYCGRVFSKIKRDFIAGRKIIPKDCCKDRNCIKTKTQESNIKKYGVPNPTQNKEIRAKQVETCLKRYGVTSPAKNEAIKKKTAETNVLKYGSTCTLHNEKIKEKTLKTWREKYGCDHPFASQDIRKKIKTTMNQKYGDYYTRTEDYLNKTKDTCRKKYGADHSSQSKEVQDKKKKTNLKKYGFEFAAQDPKVKNKMFSSGNRIKNYGKTQNEIKKYFENITGLEFKSIMLEGKEIDIYNESLKIGIEYCGLWWHNESSPDPRTKKYHWNKYNICQDNGIRLITIFEDEWIHHKDKCKNYLSSILGIFKTRIFARKTEVIELNNLLSNEFYSNFHLFGKPYGTKKTFALSYENEVVAAMSLGIHHRDSTKIVINRLCFKPCVQIVGGTSKLFSACKNWCEENSYKEIITWSDNRWSTGLTYGKIGFKLEENLGPDYSYVNLKKKTNRLSKQSQKKSNTKCPKNKTEAEWAKENHLSRIWDCGKKRWVYKLCHT